MTCNENHNLKLLLCLAPCGKCLLHFQILVSYFEDTGAVQHVTGNDQDYLRKIPRVVVQKSALL
jgi:hypothetical protein